MPAVPEDRMAPTDPLWPPTPSITDGYILHFDVAGLPAPQGSKKAFVNPRTRRAIIVDANPTTLRSWRQDVIEAAKHARGNSVPLDGSLSLLVTFWLPRPQAHYGTKGLKVQRPDLLPHQAGHRQAPPSRHGLPRPSPGSGRTMPESPESRWRRCTARRPGAL